MGKAWTSANMRHLHPFWLLITFFIAEIAKSYAIDYANRKPAPEKTIEKSTPD